MRGQAFLREHIDPFLELARREGWLCEREEFEFLMRNFPQGCFVWHEGAKPVGFITSMRYGKSGWIGNLLVTSEFRRKGIGRVLMEQAVAALLKEGAETVWLTASADGAGLYAKLGFVAIDSIYRWSGKGRLSPTAKSKDPDLESIRGIDRAGWGDRRDAVLRLSCDRGTLFTTSGGFICCQRWPNGLQLGPWGCLIGSQAAQLLGQALVPGEEEVFLDVPAGNHAAASLLQEKGFSVKGTNLLMYLGAEPDYQPEKIYALASMGSMG